MKKGMYGYFGTPKTDKSRGGRGIGSSYRYETASDDYWYVNETLVDYEAGFSEYVQKLESKELQSEELVAVMHNALVFNQLAIHAYETARAKYEILKGALKASKLQGVRV